MLNISLDNAFNIGQQGRMSSEVANDKHHQLSTLLVIDNMVGVRASIKLEFRRVNLEKRITLVSFIWLWSIFNMVSP